METPEYNLTVDENDFIASSFYRVSEFVFFFTLVPTSHSNNNFGTTRTSTPRHLATLIFKPFRWDVFRGSGI